MPTAHVMKRSRNLRVIVPQKTARRFYGHGIPGVAVGKTPRRPLVLGGARGPGGPPPNPLLGQWPAGNSPALFTTLTPPRTVQEKTWRGAEQ